MFRLLHSHVQLTLLWPESVTWSARLPGVENIAVVCAGDNSLKTMERPPEERPGDNEE